MAKARMSCGDCGRDFDSFEQWENHECDGQDDDEPMGGGALAIADGGVDLTRWYRLNAFRRDCLQFIYELETQPEPTYGLRLKEKLESEFGKEVNHGRLYPNLDTLQDRGLIEKSELDKRTNRYTLTPEGRALVEHALAEAVRIFHSVDNQVDSTTGEPARGDD